MKLYYLVMLRGLPVDVLPREIEARQIAKERSVPGAQATVMAVTPVQTEFEFEFEVEDPTQETCTYPGCDHARGLCFNNYEIG